MAEKVVIDLEVDVNKSERTLGQLEDRAEALNEELRKVPLGSKAFNELKQELVGVNKEIKNTELAMESLDNEQVASELGSVAGAVGDLTAAFVLLGGDEDSAIGETAKRIETALGVTMAFKGTIEGVISFQKLWNNTLKQTSVVQGAIATGTKIYAAAQGVLNFVIGAGSKALKLFRLALISTGIGAIVMLIANFGTIKDVIMDVINTAIAPFREALQFLGLIESDEEKARKERQEALKKRLAEEKKLRATRIQQIENNLKREEAVHNQRLSQLDNEIAIQKSLGKNTIDLEREKLKATIEFHKIQKPLLEESIALKRTDLELAIAELEASRENFKLIGAENELNKSLLQLKGQLSDLDNEQIKSTQAIQDAETQLVVFENNIATEKRKERKKAAEEKKKQDEKDIQDAKKKAEELLKIERERLQNIQDLENELYATIEELDEEARQRNLTDQQKEIEAVQEKYFALINDTRLGEEEILRLKQYAKDEEAAINQRFRDQKAAADKEAKDKEIADERELQNLKLDLATQSIQGIMDITKAFAKDNEKSQKRAFEINKRLQIAQALIATYQGANQAFTTTAANPLSIANPSLPFIAAAAAIAQGLANVATISRQQFQGGSAGGGGTTTAPNFGAGETAPTIAPVTNTSTLVPQEPQQVFVTETDITNTQNQVAVIETQATIK
jgi:hypothetical protein